MLFTRPGTTGAVDLVPSFAAAKVESKNDIGIMELPIPFYFRSSYQRLP
jgi:hypothetical protein